MTRVVIQSPYNRLLSCLQLYFAVQVIQITIRKHRGRIIRNINDFRPTLLNDGETEDQRNSRIDTKECQNKKGEEAIVFSEQEEKRIGNTASDSAKIQVKVLDRVTLLHKDKPSLPICYKRLKQLEGIVVGII
ncbi:hypothetical protein Agabi119p4_6826 [Agaricus bisporus var. burnettii]|uniref:Uncharacterized protein n=1 Tax=Agaricus bisporus var. burnettii TaxID=192524 RepID=A0A8H7KCN6_AGABI|nr:hypothetical protein Agabi119p4_6826 [Agaricus bisporus var. burnettii]